MIPNPVSDLVVIDERQRTTLANTLIGQFIKIFWLIAMLTDNFLLKSVLPLTLLLTSVTSSKVIFPDTEIKSNDDKPNNKNAEPSEPWLANSRSRLFVKQNETPDELSSLLAFLREVFLWVYWIIRRLI